MARPRKKDYNEISSLLYDVHHHNINVISREIFLHSPDSGEEESGIDYRSSTTFIKNLRILEYLSSANITIHMHIIGGSWPDGMAMFDAIRNAKSYVTIVAYAQASSMSGVLLQSADWRVMTANTHFMLHYGSVGVEATTNAASEWLKFNVREGQKMLDIFVSRAMKGRFFASKKWSEKKISEYLDQGMKSRGDWYLDAQEALDYGFVDEIIGNH